MDLTNKAIANVTIYIQCQCSDKLNEEVYNLCSRAKNEGSGSQIGLYQNQDKYLTADINRVLHSILIM